MRYSFPALVGHALRGHRGWPRLWREPEPKAAYDVVAMPAVIFTDPEIVFQLFLEFRRGARFDRDGKGGGRDDGKGKRQKMLFHRAHPLTRASTAASTAS